MKFIDITGKKFGSLTVLERAPSFAGAPLKWKCQCDCGNTYVAQGRYLKSGATTSCGCAQRGRKVEELCKQEMRRSSDALDGLRMDEDNPYQNLANAIVAVAADDYREAVKNGNPGVVKSIEKFFHSDWYKMLTNINGGQLLSLLQKDCDGELCALNI